MYPGFNKHYEGMRAHNNTRILINDTGVFKNSMEPAPLKKTVQETS